MTAGYDIGLSGSSSATSGLTQDSAFNVTGGGGGPKPAVQISQWLIVGFFALIGLWLFLNKR